MYLPSHRDCPCCGSSATVVHVDGDFWKVPLVTIIECPKCGGLKLTETPK